MSNKKESHIIEKKAHSSTPMSDPRVQNITDNLEQMQEKIEKRIEEKMHESQEKIESMLVSMQRPKLSADPQIKQYDNAFDNYIRRGIDTSLQSLESKSYRSDATGAEGGFLVSPKMQEAILGRMQSLSPFRSLANVVSIGNGSVEFLVDPDSYGADWVSETGVRSETGTGLFRKVTITAHDLYAMPKATQRVLDDTNFNIEGWISNRVSEKFSTSEQSAFIVGNGVDKPHGILSKTMVENSSYSWGNIGYVKTGDADGLATTNPQDVLLDVIYALPSGYRHDAVFLMNSKTMAFLRKLKDSDGRYLISSDNNLLGYPLHIVEDMPDIGTDATPIAFGNFKRGYAVVDNGGVRILRDPYSAKPNIFFYVVKRVGGDVIDYNAIKLIKCEA